jgi:serine/threonine protein kinase
MSRLEIFILIILFLLGAPLCLSTSLSELLGPGRSALPIVEEKDVQLQRFIDSGKFSNVYEATYKSKPCIVKILKPGGASYKILREIDILQRCDDLEGVIDLIGVTESTIDDVDERAHHHDGGTCVALIFESVGEQYQWLSHCKGRTLPPLPGTAAAVAAARMSSEQGETDASGSGEEGGGDQAAASASAAAAAVEPLSSEEIKYNMYKVLLALQKVHRRGIMHRDVKPRNCIVDRGNGKVKLIDFGHAEDMLGGKQYSNRVGSRSFKAPELLFNYATYDCAIDVWASGCMFCGLIFKLEPFFYSRPDPQNLGIVTAIAKVKGSDALHTWAGRYGIKLTNRLRHAIGSHPRVPLLHFRNDENRHLCSEQAVDLCERMLTIDHNDRYTVDMCLEHPYFDSVRK